MVGVEDDDDEEESFNGKDSTLVRFPDSLRRNWLVSIVNRLSTKKNKIKNQPDADVCAHVNGFGWRGNYLHRHISGWVLTYSTTSVDRHDVSWHINCWWLRDRHMSVGMTWHFIDLLCKCNPDFFKNLFSWESDGKSTVKIEKWVNLFCKQNPYP